MWKSKKKKYKEKVKKEKQLINPTTITPNQELKKKHRP